MQILKFELIWFIQIHKLLTEYYFWGSDESFHCCNEHLTWTESHEDFNFYILLIKKKIHLIEFFIP